MLILISIALLGFGLLLFSFGITVLLIVLAVRITIWLFTAGISTCRWLRQRRTGVEPAQHLRLAAPTRPAPLKRPQFRLDEIP